MKLGIMQPYFLPYIGYFQLINAVDKYVIYDDVNFIKRGWINRNRLLLNENDFLFTLILEKASQNKLIHQINVANDQSKILKTIETAYKKAPFFANIFPLIESIIIYPDKNLAQYTGNSLIQLSNYLDINTEFIYSSHINKNYSLKAQEKILHICKSFDATEYINAIGGQELYSKDSFKNNGIRLKFLQSNPIEYKQFNNEFIPSLSILDVMMFNSKEEINLLLQQYELV